MKRKYGKFAGAFFSTDGFDGAGDFVGAGHKDQHVAFGSALDRFFKGISGGFPDGVMFEVDSLGRIVDVDGEHTAFAFQLAAGG